MLPTEAPSEVVPAVELPQLNLPVEDDVPLESAWHRAEINLLIESIRYHWRDRIDFYAGGNMFIYYSLEQAEAVTREVDADIVPPPDKRAYRGPDFFVVEGVDGTRERETWVVWEEGGHYPDLIVELLSPSTAKTDLTKKKELYEQVFHTAEYYCYDPADQKLIGWHLQSGRYAEQSPDTEGRLWSDVFQLSLGTWEGEFQERQATWLRFFDADGQLVLIRAEAERQRAEAAEAEAEGERQRADALEAELERTRARLAELEGES